MSEWLRLENVQPLNPGPRHWELLSRLIIQSGTAGNLTNDTHLAAIAFEHSALLCSADNDFQRFQGVQYHNPLAADGVKEPSLAYG